MHRECRQRHCHLCAQLQQRDGLERTPIALRTAAFIAYMVLLLGENQPMPTTDDQQRSLDNEKKTVILRSPTQRQRRKGNQCQ